MGLDVYLYTAAQHDANVAHDRAWDEVSPRWDAMSKADRDAFYAAHPHPYGNHEDVPSAAYPDHYWNRRYLRSSYNGSGFNRAVPDMLGDDCGLHWIFEPVQGGEKAPEALTAEHLPALEECKARALTVAERLRACDPLRTISATALIGAASHLWGTLPSEGQVLQWYRTELARKIPGPDDWYSSAKGLVLGQGVPVLAATVGRDVLGTPCAVLVYRSTEGRDYLVQAAEIAAEFCDEAIALVKADGRCHVAWSG